MKVYIYSLNDPDSLSVRYIGKTMNLKKRLSSHINEAKRCKGRRYVLNWIKSLLDINKKPIINIIEECTQDNWEEKERYWVDHYRKIIPNLCNNADGGLGGSGTKNYTPEEINQRRIVASNNFSSYSNEQKIGIWNTIKDKPYRLVKTLITRNIYFQVINGYVWNDITGLSKPVKKHTTIRNKNSGVRLTDTQINEIKSSKLTHKQLASVYNVSQATIWRIKTKW